MRYSPRTPQQIRAIRELILSLPEDMEAVYLIGFDWRLHRWVLGPFSDAEVREDVLACQDDRCYRAIVYACPSGDITRIHILEIGGNGFYTLNYHRENKAMYWCPPQRELFYELDQLVSR